VYLARSAKNDALKLGFISAYKAANNQSFPADGTESIFDAFYATMYALHIATKNGADSPETLTPKAFSDAIARLAPPGFELSVGNEGLHDGFDFVTGPGDPDLVGAFTNLDWALDGVGKGSPLANGELFCVAPPSDAGAQTLFVSAGVRFNAATAQASGTFLGGAACAQ
jgi:hypothetical protein